MSREVADPIFLPAQLIIGLDFTCGCKQRWRVYRMPDDDEPAIKVLDGDCTPLKCEACQDYKANGLGDRFCLTRRVASDD